jgi:hypothetical protein
VAYIGNQPTTTAFLTDTFSANGSGTVFTLSAAPANTNSIIVAVSGVLQDPSTYSVSGTALTFSAAPPAGTGNISVRFLGIPASGIVNTAYRTQTEFTATAGQTTFSVPSYTVGFIDVYRNGALLGSADFTATNGTTVVLTAGASAGDLVETVSFYVSSVLNAIPATAGAVNSTYLLDGSVTQAKLSTNVAGNGPAFSATKSANQTVTSGVFTTITFDTEQFDTNNNFASNTFTPTVAGYYQINLSVYCASSATTTRLIAQILKNGGSYRFGTDVTQATGSESRSFVSTVVYMNGTTDYLTAAALPIGTGTLNFGNLIDNTCFNGVLVRAA